MRTRVNLNHKDVNGAASSRTPSETHPFTSEALLKHVGVTLLLPPLSSFISVYVKDADSVNLALDYDLRYTLLREISFAMTISNYIGRVTK